MRTAPTIATTVTLALLLAGCTSDGGTPTGPTAGPAQPVARIAWGPETPPFNLEVVLRGAGFGLVKFRQPNNDNAIIYLDTWVRGLVPGAEYLLQRAVDTALDEVCTGAAWLTLGRGLQPQSLVTDDGGTAREQLWRDVSAFAPGAGFDIHFRVVNAQTQSVVLQSDCYRFRISL